MTALLVVIVGVALLVVLAARWAPAQPTVTVTAADIDLDFSEAEQEREGSFRRRVRPWSLASVLLDVLVVTVLTFTGAVASATAASHGPWWVQVVAGVTLVLIVSRAVTLPSAVAVRRASLDVGLATGTWRRWFRDLMLGFGLSWLLVTGAMLGWVGAARMWPTSWWFVVGLVAAVLVVVLSFLVPVVVEPLFARFEPLPAGPLRDRLLGLARRDGVEVRDVLVADASRRTSALNAYVSGLGSTRRVVVNDTLLDAGDDDAVQAVVAHELGHVVAHDVRTGTVLGAVGAAVGVAAASVLLAQPGLLSVSHVTSVSDPTVVGLLMTLGAWAGLLGSPLQTAMSRRIERRADRHCLDLTADPTTVARMHRSLAVTNMAALRPPRLLHLWFGTHPTSPERIADARAWARDHGVDVPGPMRGGPSAGG